MNDQPENTPATPGADGAQLAELEQLIAELKDKVSALRAEEFDAASLEQKLRELNELAVRAAGAVDSASR